MNDFSIMNMLHSQAKLGEPIENLIFREGPVSLLFDLLPDITTVGVVHDNTQLPFLGLECLNELDNIWMLQMFNDLSLLKGFPFLIFAHPANINDLHYAQKSI